MLSIFLSHSSSDNGFVKKLASRLRAASIEVWYAEGQIRPGESLVRKLKAKIDEVDYLGVVLSPDSAHSDWVSREINWAYKQQLYSKDIRLVPILLRDCPFPNPLKDVRFVDFRDRSAFDASVAELVGILSEGTHESDPMTDSRGETWSLQAVRNGFDFGVISETDGELELSKDFRIALDAVAEDRLNKELESFLNEGFFDLTIRAMLRTHPGSRIDKKDIELLAKELSPRVLTYVIDLATSYGLVERKDEVYGVPLEVREQFGELLITRLEGGSSPTRSECAKGLIELARYQSLANGAGDSKHAYVCAALLYHIFEELGFFSALGI